MNNDNITKIKNTVSLEQYLAVNGMAIKKSGTDSLTCPCPLCQHQDCFRITPSRKLFKCFSCNTHGDVIELHKQIHALKVKDAILDLAQKFNIETALPLNEKTNTKTALNDKSNDKSRQQTILNAAVAYYNQVAQASIGFKSFLLYRKFSFDLTNSFLLGYADGNLYHHLSTKGFTPDQMKDSGLVRENDNGTLYDYFKSQVIYPFFDNAGNVIHIKGKGIDQGGAATNKTWQLPQSKSTLFFNGIKKPESGEPLYIVDGENDVISLAKAGVVAWASGGTMSDEQLKTLRDSLLKSQNIIFIPDNDNAGLQTLEKMKKEFQNFSLPTAIRKLTAKFGQYKCLKLPEQYKDIDEMLRHQNSVEPTLPLLNLTPVNLYPPLNTCIKYYHEIITDNEIKYSADVVGQIIFEYLEKAGVFFVIGEDAYYIHNGNQYQVNNNLPFKSLLYQLAGINYADRQSKVIWEGIQAQCYYKSPHTDYRGWLYTDHTNPDTPTIYYNLCNKNNEIIRINPNRVEKLLNGCNDKTVFLMKSPKTKPINYQNLTDKEMIQGLTVFFNLFVPNLACEMEWRIYIVCLIINSIFLEMAKAHGINKFSGSQGSGKTEAAGMVTALLYGQNFVTVGSTASDYTDAALNPITICDNLEIHNITPDRRDLLLCVATGITRQKRKSGTDSSNVYEKTVTQIITTSIESFELPELIERAITIPFSQSHFNPNYQGAVTVEQQIIANRDLILSSIFKLASYILIDFPIKKRTAYQYLEERHNGHAKKRLNEHLACISVIQTEFLKQVPVSWEILPLPSSGNTPDSISLLILDQWISHQDGENSEIMQETNIIVRYLNLLSQESANKNLGDYHIQNLAFTQDTDDLRLEITTNQLLSVFELLAKKYNLKQNIITLTGFPALVVISI